MPRRPRRALGVLAIAALLVPGAAAPGSPAAPGEPAPAADEATFAYAGEAPPAMPWRAAIEEAAIFGMVLTFYAIQPLGAPGARPPTLAEKLTFSSRGLDFDADNLPTNYPGHSVAGMWYYLVARGNRLPVAGALAATAASGLAWEMAEFHEPASINDLVNDVAGGFALGEAFTQLAVLLEREGLPVLAFLAAPPKALHDLADGGRARTGPYPGAARAGISLLSGVRWAGACAAAPTWGMATRIDLLRIAEYGAPGSGWRWLLDGNATALGAELLWDPSQLAEVDVLAAASLVGLYAREVDGDGDGQDLVATLGTAFDYQRRATPSGQPWPNDYLALLRIPGLSLRHRVLDGALRVETTLEAAVEFGAVQPFALLGEPTDLPGVPGVTRLEGYYHGLGWMAAPGLLLRLGPIEAGVSARVDRLSPVTTRDLSPPAPPRLALSDGQEEARAFARWRLPWRGVELSARWLRRSRWGWAGDVERTLVDTELLMGVGVGR
ncbi:MAG TPA: DUF3943 domain-containing protein [Anaeromyxobacter sp.]|nr:DUF3943 domain-containing protein [Anaeromyxobacter sp.]